ncbi:hypothetical protein [uncultured Chitinophaga sp.]|uniref:hypothetical protein n=1 Tax=uncultured Chitinophaga sp. TaxID=339340 RepID=UPI0025D6DD3A|nr:hypothetical protein [uncultured Chitinophaga sp.]
MKRGAVIFWTLYMLFFAIPFPMILYYAITSGYDDSMTLERNPWVSLTLLGISVIAWLVLLATWLKRWIVNVFVVKQNISQIQSEGVRRDAKVLSSVNISKPGATYETYEIKLGFNNLAGSAIEQVTQVNDTKSYERRFDTGKTVSIVIDKEVKNIPYFMFETAEAEVKKSRIVLLVLGWLAIIAAVIGYYIFSYQFESHGMGWRFLGFGHPLVICPLVLLFYRGLFGLIFSRLGGGTARNNALLKFKGIRTTARLINASQTGLYVNEQPMVKFELEYTDRNQNIRRASVKKIVNLLDLGTVKQEQADIFYLEEKPELVAFASDLD